MTPRKVADLPGLLAAIAGTLGSIALAFPLFHLLRAREAVEDLERGLDVPGISHDQADEMRRSLRDLRIRVHQRRKTVTKFGVLGVALLAATLILLAWQGALLYRQAWRWAGAPIGRSWLRFDNIFNAD